MEPLTIIVVLSAALWYCIDRFKPLWENLSWHKYMTVLIAAIGAFGLVFGFDLDLLSALGITLQTTLAGKIFTGIVLMSGSSAISEIITKLKIDKK